MTRRTRDDWLEAGGRPKRNAQAHVDAWVKDNAERVLGPDPTGLQLAGFLATYRCELRLVARTLGHRVSTLQKRILAAGFTVRELTQPSTDA